MKLSAKQPNLLKNKRRIFIECTSTFINGGNSGIQRVVRNLVNCNLALTYDEADVFPIIWTGNKFFRIFSELSVRPHITVRIKQKIRQLLYAKSGNPRRILKSVLLISRVFLPKSARSTLTHIMRESTYISIKFGAIPLKHFFGRTVCFRSNDIVVLVDATWQAHSMLWFLFEAQRSNGVKIVTMIHDLFPLILPETCAENTIKAYVNWFEIIAPRTDFFLTNSEATRASLQSYLQQHPELAPQQFISDSFKLGATLDAIDKGKNLLEHQHRLWSIPGKVLLSVGTIEPRKNIGFLLDTYDTLRDQDLNISLIIVGRYGWKSAELIERIKKHRDYGTRLLYLDNASDNELASAIERADCLVCSSIAEGFGLPVVEGLSYNLEVFASDIPSFREIGSSYCHFFDLEKADSLSVQLQSWLLTPSSGKDVIPVKEFSWPSWQESSVEFIQTTLKLIEKDTTCSKIQ